VSGRPRLRAIVITLTFALLTIAVFTLEMTGRSPNFEPKNAIRLKPRRALLPPRPLRAHTVGIRGGHFVLNGKALRAIGINVPQAASDTSVNGGCGAEINLRQFFATLRPHTFVRVGFGQDAAINVTTGRIDWAGLDRVVRAAELSPSHPKLIVGLTSQSGVCDADQWKGAAWYEGGYRKPFLGAPDGIPRLSFWTWVTDVVRRYRSSSAVALWEPVGEPEPSTCLPGYAGPACYGHTVCPPNAPMILRRFFDAIGAHLRKLDPWHGVATGAIGANQCGWTFPAPVDASPFVDVLTVHDYGDADVALPNWIDERLKEAEKLGKPLLDEEVGIAGRDTPSCTSLSERATELRAKERADLASGIAGFLVWASGDGAPVNYDTCDYYLLPSDPALEELGVTRS
jgi:mannan endo-1,4-beta-mannosidase